MNTSRPIKYLWLLVGSLIIATSGCGEPDLIVTDSTPQSEDISIDETETIVTEESDNSGIGGWWGIRQVKETFSSSNNDVDPNMDSNLPFSATASETPANPDDVWMSQDQATSDAEYQRATELIAAQQFVEAQAILLDIIQRHPESSSAWRWLADCYYNQLQLAEAIRAYQKARSLYPENYFAMRGEGFAHLHYGNELWRLGNRKQAHEEYRQALRTLQECMRIYPGDVEALYGRSMAAEGASRRLYQNAITLLRAQRIPDAESEAGICIEVISEGIESARQRLLKNPDEIGPIIITGGLFQRRAILLKNFKRYAQALDDIDNAVAAYEAVLSISPDNLLAKKELEKCTKYQEEISTLLENDPTAF